MTAQIPTGSVFAPVTKYLFSTRSGRGRGQVATRQLNYIVVPSILLFHRFAQIP